MRCARAVCRTDPVARFRVRKKQREAALAASATELHQRVTELESEVTKLQVENGILRGAAIAPVARLIARRPHYRPRLDL